jgi:two-component system CheB/CheR fusion protein
LSGRLVDSFYGDEVQDLNPQGGLKMRADKTKEKFRCSTPIVAVGASAGGLEAFQKFLSHLPKLSGMAFVLIQHLDPDHETLMPELLQGATDMPIEQVNNKVQVKENHIYFIAPNSTLTIKGNFLITEKPKEAHGHRSPIDIFFKSLAEQEKGESIGIILSGAGSDGSIGIKAIKEAGGLTFAQSLESSKYDGMPRNAVKTGMVDFVMDIESMSEELVKYIKHKVNSKSDSKTPSEEAKKILTKVCKYLLRHLNHDFSKYKENTLLRRIHRRMQMSQIEDGPQYFQFVKSNKDEAKSLLNDFLIGVTYFFRDAEVFQYLKSDVIPKILENNRDLVRIWVPGCATGEEAYSIAILFREVMEELDIDPKVQIFATDLDEKSVATARAGVYTEGIAEHVSPYRLKNYFSKVDHNYKVKKKIRDMCIFSKHDLQQDPPFAKLDLVSCRNLLIYFGPELQVNAMALFTYSVKNNGYLLLGPTESIRGDNSQFEVINKKYKVFRNLNSYYLPIVSFPLKFTGVSKNDSAASNPQEFNRVRQHSGFSQKIDNLMLKEYIPPHIIVNEHFDVQFFSLNLEEFIVPANGVPSNNITKVIVPSLRVELRSLLTKCYREKENHVKEKVFFEANSEKYFLNIKVETLEHVEGLEKLFLIVFNKTKIETSAIDSEGGVTGSDAKPQELEQLHSELKSVKELLHLTDQELEHANEQLKNSDEKLLSLNEEMLSGNEELQTSHEEMQSINEELETVNLELSTKLEQLDSANSDLENLFRSNEVATIFLDNNLKIKRYTPKAKSIFHFIHSDLSRPITDLALTFDDYDIKKELYEVTNLLLSKNHTVKLSNSEKWFKLQMHPYKSVKKVIEGVILTLYDVTELKKAEEELKSRLSQQVSVAEFGFKALSNEMELSKLREHVVRILKDNLKVDFTEILELQDSGTSFLLVEGLGWENGLTGKAVLGTEVKSQAGFTLHSQSPVLVTDLNTEKRFSGPDLLIDHDVRSGISVIIKGASGRAYGVLSVHSKTPDYFSEQDIQYVQSIANTLATAIERHGLVDTKTRLAQIVNSSKDMIFSCDSDERINTWNPAAEKVFDVKAKDVIGKDVFKYILRESNLTDLEDEIKLVLQGDSSVEEIQCEFFNSIGNKVVLSLNLTPIKGSQGKIEGVSFVGRDISEQINNQQLLIDAKNSADEANELKSRFMGVLSHELRTPLSSIMGYSDLIIRSTNISDSERDKYLQKISTNGSILHSLLSDILDVSKIEEGKVDINNTFFKLKDFMSELTSTLGDLAHKKNLKLDVSYSGNVPGKIKTDPLRLRQIIENVVSNAIKYTSTGGIKIRLLFSDEGVSDKALIVEVEDTGRGISKAKALSLFSPFFRAEPSKGAPGVGLGLYLSKNLAHQLGGRLSLLESTENKGSTFKLYLPVKLLENVTEAARPNKSDEFIVTNTILKNKNILLAEDSEDLRGLFTAYLELAGAKVSAFENGQLALESLKKNKYDLAILDLFMPEMDGKELVAEMKKLSITTPTVVVTAHAMSNVRQECLDFGFKDYLSKPVTQENLVKTVLRNL